MRWLILFLLGGLFSSSFAQGITAPSPLTIEANASGVDAGDFVISWPNTTDNLLVSLSLDYQSGTTISFPVITGLTRNYGYTSWTNVTSIVFYGTRDYINAGLAAMTIAMGSTKTAVRINLEVSQYDASYVYNPVNKHFYKFVSGAITYTNAKSGASSQASFKGKTPYLATITSQAENDFINNNLSYTNIWVAMSDATTEGRWVFDAGPEATTNFWNTSVAGITNTTYTSYASTGITVTNQYSNWCSNEPNNADGSRNGEDCVVAKSGGATCWNDLADGNTGSVSGYLVEISADFPAGSDYTGVYNSYVVHNNDMAFTLSSGSSLSTATVSNKSNLYGGLQLNDGHTITLPTATTLNTNKMIFSGTGKIVFTDATSKWTPGTSSAANTITHSPSTNSNPTYWSVSSSWSNDSFNGGGSYPHYSPWLNSYQGWSGGAADFNQWIILNYSTPVYITGIQTQGRQNSGQWVTTAKIETSLDKITWKTIYTNATMNNDQTTIVNVLFPNVEYAQYVRVTPTGFYGHPSMRMGLLIKQ
jgi:F5/8 type C domain/Lectin C-type domain